MDSIIRLFKAIPIASQGQKTQSNNLLAKTIEKGFIFAPEVVFNYSEQELVDLIKRIEKEIGLSDNQLNSSFHKSWTKIRDSSMFQLVLEQLIHYFTTYGFEALGIYNEDSVYIPYEKLEIPDLKEGITFTVIKGYTKEELKQKLLGLLNQGIALKEDTIKDVVNVSLFVDLNEGEIEQIKNKETKILLYDSLNKVPKDPVEFLRFLIYKSIDKTLLIKDKKTIEEIKSKHNLNVLGLFIKYEDEYGLETLAQIFYRFKPLFLAFKSNYKLNHIINRIRKLAKKHHKPMRQDYLNEITAKIKRGENIEEGKLREELSRVNTFRKVRLAYALNFRTKDVDSILYKIRNGKGYATDFCFDRQDEAKRVYEIVLKSIVEDVKKNVAGKKVYIPENIVYSLPTTEKQFTGDFPCGSYIIIPEDMIVGVHWDNVSGQRIDLDLSLLNSTGKMGWDSYYRNDDRSILFSGDITDAPKPNGASELFYIRKQTNEPYIMFINYYNYDSDIAVPFKILIAKECVSDFERNYMVNPNNVLCVAKSKIDKKQKILGLLVPSSDGCRFYFSETDIGKSITSSGNCFVDKSRQYLFDFYTNAISLNEVLRLAEAEIMRGKEGADIDLSPENLEKDKIIKLILNRKP